MKIVLLSSEDYTQRILEKSVVKESEIYGFYSSEFEAICLDPRLLRIHVSDHGFHRGDGVFEALRYENRKIYLCQEHLIRLRNSAQRLKMELPYNDEEFTEIIKELCRVTGREVGEIRIYVSRGQGGFGLNPRDCSAGCTVHIVAHKSQHTPPAEKNELGVAAVRSDIMAKPSWLAKIKTLNYIPNVCMKMEADDKGVDYVLSFDSENNLSESYTENICFIDKDNNLIMSDFSNALSGTVMNRVAILSRDKLGLNVIQRKLVERDILECKEAILLATSLCLGVVRYNGHAVGDAKVGFYTNKFRELISLDVLEYGNAF